MPVVIWSEAAIQDIKRHFDFLNPLNPDAAARAVRVILDAGNSLSISPYRGTVIDPLTGLRRIREFGLSSRQQIVVNGNRRLLGLVTVSNQSANNIDQAVHGAAVARMLDLRNILELVNDGFDDGALAEQQAITEGHEAILHIALELGYQLHAHAFEQLLSQLLRDIALVGKHLAKQSLQEFRHGSAVIGVARREHKVE